MALVTMKAPAGIANGRGAVTHDFYVPQSDGFFLVDSQDQAGFEADDWLLVNTTPPVNNGLPALPIAVAESRDTGAGDNNVTLVNDTATNITITIAPDTITSNLKLIQTLTGTITVVDGAGVTFIGATLATVIAGDCLQIECVGANVYAIYLQSV